MVKRRYNPYEALREGKTVFEVWNNHFFWPNFKKAKATKLTNADSFQRGNTKKKRSCEFFHKSHAANWEAASPRRIPKMQLALECIHRQ